MYVLGGEEDDDTRTHALAKYYNGYHNIFVHVCRYNNCNNNNIMYG